MRGLDGSWVGGSAPDEDAAALKRDGVAAVFQPGASLESIVAFIREACRGKR